jgi:hypothetical protein
MKDRNYTNCRNCGSPHIMAIQYTKDNKCYYDGVSEWQCHDCEHRIGRWSNHTLKKGQHESPPNPCS